MLDEMKVVLDEGPRLNLGAGRSIAQRQEMMEAALAARYSPEGDPATELFGADGVSPSSAAGAGGGQIFARDRPAGMEVTAVGGAAEQGHGDAHGENAPRLIPVGDEQWGRYIALLTAFREREGSCEVPVKHEEQGVELGVWLSMQRQAHKKGTLDATRRERLEALGVVWGTSIEQQWERKLRAAGGVPRARGGLRGACEARGGGREARGLVGDAAESAH